MFAMSSFSGPWVNLRIRTAMKIHGWEGFENDALNKAYGQLARILGHKNGTLAESFTERDATTCVRLLGPNGYAIYRMLLVKHGLTKS